MNLVEASTLVVPVVLAVTFHEAAHGFVAYQFGDDTAWRAGRVTFNPVKHIDLFGTIILPALLLFSSSGRFMFGYAKPVPVNFRRLNRPRRDMVWVAVAGPATNVLLAIASSFLLYGVGWVPASSAEWVVANLWNSVQFNALICVFNMLPLPPLDGGRVAVGLLPDALALPLARLERYGILILLLFLFVLPFVGEQIGYNLNILGWVISRPADALSHFVLAITGVSDVNRFTTLAVTPSALMASPAPAAATAPLVVSLAAVPAGDTVCWLSVVPTWPESTRPALTA